MKKRILSFVLMLCMIFAMCPAAFAAANAATVAAPEGTIYENDEVSITVTGVTNASDETFTGDVTVNVTSGTAVDDNETTNLLTNETVSISEGSGTITIPAGTIQKADTYELTITMVEGENQKDVTGSPLSLTVTADQSAATVAYDSASITSGDDVTLKISNAKAKDGAADFSENAANVTITSSNTELDGIEPITATADFSEPAGQADVTISGEFIKAGQRDLTVVIDGIKTVTFDANTLTVAAGSAAKLAEKTAPVGPAASGGELATQPSVEIQDENGNLCTADSTTEVTAAVKAGQVDWSLAGTTTATAQNGVATFENLTATATSAAVSAANITFSVADNINISTVDSTAFAIPAPDANASDAPAKAVLSTDKKSVAVTLAAPAAIGDVIKVYSDAQKANKVGELTVETAGAEQTVTITGDVTGNVFVTFTDNANSKTESDVTESQDAAGSTDTTAPTLSATSVDGITAAGANLKFTSDEAGKYYYVVLASNVQAPADAAAIKANANVVSGDAAASANTVAVSNLTPATSYNAYLFVEDASGNASSVETLAIETLNNDASLKTVLTKAVTAGGEAGSSIAPKTVTVSVDGAATISSNGSDFVATDTNATVDFYGKDSAFTTPAEADVTVAAGASETVYVKVTAEDATEVFYKVTVNSAVVSEDTSEVKNENGVDTAVATVTEGNVTTAIDSVGDNGALTIDVTKDQMGGTLTSDDADAAKVTIPNNAVSAIATAEKVTTTVVKTPVGEVALSKEAMTAINTQAETENVVLNIKPDDSVQAPATSSDDKFKAFDISFVKEISQTPVIIELATSKLTLTFPIDADLKAAADTAAAADARNKIIVIFVKKNEAGEITGYEPIDDADITADDDNITFKTAHLSTYAQMLKSTARELGAPVKPDTIEANVDPSGKITATGAVNNNYVLYQVAASNGNTASGSMKYDGTNAFKSNLKGTVRVWEFDKDPVYNEDGSMKSIPIATNNISAVIE